MPPTSSRVGSETTRLLAGAVCSYGVFDLGPDLPDADALAGAVSAAGFDGIDLGPVGYLGRGRALHERLKRHGLELAGGWVQLVPEDDGLRALDNALDAFDAVDAGAQRAPARPTLAVSGPAEPVIGRPTELDERAWAAMVRSVCRATQRCRSRGYEPTFHPHVGTWVETPAHVDRLLGDTDVGLCLDTGHLLLGGGSLAAALERWSRRINHLHLKDVRLQRARALAVRRAPLAELWRRGTFCELGAGDVDVDMLRRWAGRFSGWVVVEQDRILPPGSSLTEAAAAQRHNHAYLKARAW